MLALALELSQPLSPGCNPLTFRAESPAASVLCSYLTFLSSCCQVALGVSRTPQSDFRAPGMPSLPFLSSVCKGHQILFWAGELRTNPAFHKRMRSGSSRRQLVHSVSLERTTDSTYCGHAHLQACAKDAPLPSIAFRPILTLRSAGLTKSSTVEISALL